MTSKPVTSKSIKSVLEVAFKQLEPISDTAYLDVELILAHCLEKERSYLHTWPDRALSAEQILCFNELLSKRLDDYPVAYLLGTKAFWTLDLQVTPDVLIPRPETELLVETALERIKDIENPKILDLGTGSGAIALALAVEREDATITATDISSAALEIATKNAASLNLDSRVRFIQSNWYENIEMDENKFDVIVSNPPYVAPDDPHLQQSIRHEPLHALVAADRGLRDIKNIIEVAKLYLKAGSCLMIEHGYDQADSVYALFDDHGYDNIKMLHDLGGIPRLSLGCLRN